MSNIEAQSNALLRTVAARQAIVDRLLGRSTWDGFVFAIAGPMIVNVVVLFGWVAWAQSRNEPTPMLLGGMLVTLFWVSIAVVRVAGRLRALATVLDQSGSLTQFVAGNARLSDGDSQESQRPAG